MAIDARATVTCSLGPIISASISDDYIQGSGLIKTSGSIEVEGIVTPGTGTVVTISYVMSNGATGSIPRRMLVLSYFCDPFRGKTSVQVGCDITFNESATEVLSWTPFDDPSNSDLTEEETRIVTRPIHGTSIVGQCIGGLGLTTPPGGIGAGTNGMLFSIPSFDFGGGYANILSDLLVSEGNCGYMREDGFFDTFRNDEPAGRSVISANDLIDIGEIGSGDTPGSRVTVSYSSLKLKVAEIDPQAPPDPATPEQTTARVLWEEDSFTGANQTIIVTAKDGNRESSSSYEYIPRTFIKTTYDEWDRVVKRVTEEYYIGAVTCSSFISAACEYSFKAFNEAGWPAIGNTPFVRTTVDEIFYDIPVDPYTTLGAGAKPRPENYDEVKSELTTVTDARATVVCGAPVNWLYYDDDFILQLASPPDGYTITEITETTYEKGTRSLFIQIGLGAGAASTRADFPVTKTIVKRKKSYILTSAGSAHLSRLAQQETNPGLVIGLSDDLVDDGVEVRIVSGREAVLQSRPSKTELLNKQFANPGRAATIGNSSSSGTTDIDDGTSGYSTISESEIIVQGGFGDSKNVVSFSLPYAPDDTFVKLPNGVITDPETGFPVNQYIYISFPSGAESYASSFGRIQNRLLLGNRFGMSMQMTPDKMPDRPFSLISLEYKGTYAAYVTNGTSWTIDQGGIIASTDALFWGAIGSDNGGIADVWFPLAPGVTVLPETPPIVGGEIQTDVFLPPVHELTKFGATSRTKVFVRRFDYELVTLTEVAPTSKTRANVKILIITRVVDTVDVTVNSYAPSIPVQVPATNVDTTIGVIQASPLLSPAPVSLVNVQIYPPGVTSA
jgi:hypothetical protein